MTSEVAQSHCLCTELLHGDIVQPQPAPFLERVHYQRKVSRVSKTSASRRLYLKLILKSRTTYTVLGLNRAVKNSVHKNPNFPL
jgi:hypothetical protein